MGRLRGTTSVVPDTLADGECAPLADAIDPAQVRNLHAIPAREGIERIATADHVVFP